MLFLFGFNSLFGQSKSSLEFQFFTDVKYSSENNFNYNIKRTLLIYRQDISENFNFCIAGDTYTIDNNKTFYRDPYLKRAFLNYSNKKISLTAGLFVTEQFLHQRKLWELRYLDKTFRYKYQYGDNRNTGILFKHKISSTHQYDIAVTIGQVTPLIKNSRNFSQIMAGQTFRNNNWTFRHFHTLALTNCPEHTLSITASNQLNNFLLTIESAILLNKNNLSNEDYTGLSIFTHWSLQKNIKLFSRYDINYNLNHKEIDTQNIWIGIEYKPSDFIHSCLFIKSSDISTQWIGVSLFINHKYLSSD